MRKILLKIVYKLQWILNKKEAELMFKSNQSKENK